MVRAAAVVLGLFVAMSACLAGNAVAQTEPAPADTEQLEALVETLEDDTRRAELVEQLKTLIEVHESAAADEPATETAGARAVAAFSRGIAGIGNQLDEAADVLADAPATLRAVSARVNDPESRDRWLLLLGKLAAILVAGLIARCLRGVQRQLGQEALTTGMLRRQRLELGDVARTYLR